MPPLDIQLALALTSVSFMVALSALLILPSWRARPSTLLSAVLFGVPVAFAVSTSPLPPWIAVFTCILATLTGPATIIKWNGVTLTELLQDLRKVRDSLATPTKPSTDRSPLDAGTMTDADEPSPPGPQTTQP